MGRRCCCGSCETTDLIDDGEWTNWNPLPPSTPTNTIAAGSSRTYAADLLFEDWTVDVELTYVPETTGPTITVGTFSAKLTQVTGQFGFPVNLVELLGADCKGAVAISATKLWLRFQSASNPGNGGRYRRIEVWAIDPSTATGSDAPTHETCRNDAPDDSAVDYSAFNITIAAGASQDLTVASVVTSTTSQVDPTCPVIRTCTPTACDTGGQFTNLIADATITLAGYADVEVSYRYQGKFDDNGTITPPIDITQTISLDLSVLNGTYYYQLKNGSTALTPAEIAAFIAQAEAGVCPADIPNYVWELPGVDLSTSDSVVLGPDDSGWNFEINDIDPGFVFGVNTVTNRIFRNTSPTDWITGNAVPMLFERSMEANYWRNVGVTRGKVKSGIFASAGYSPPSPLPASGRTSLTCVSQIAPVFFDDVQASHSFSVTETPNVSVGSVTRTWSGTGFTGTRSVSLTQVEI